MRGLRGLLGGGEERGASRVHFLREEDERRLRRSVEALPWSRLSLCHQRRASLRQLFLSLQLSPEEAALCRPLFSFLPPGEEESGQEHVSLNMFCFYLWNFCSVGGKVLARFVFGLLSPVSTEGVCERHMIKILKFLNYQGFQDHKQELFEALSGVRHTAHTFSLLCCQYVYILEPLVQVQHKLRREFLGNSFWQKIKLSRAMDEHISSLQREGSGGESGLLKTVVKFYYSMNSKQILKDTKSSECLFLKTLLSQYDWVEFINCCYEIVLEHKKISTTALQETENLSCHSCSQTLPVAVSSMELRASHLLFKRNKSERNRFPNVELPFHEESDNQSVAKVCRSHSITLICFDDQQQICPSLDHESSRQLLELNNNILCLQAVHQFSASDERTAGRKLFQSCSTLTVSTIGDQEEIAPANNLVNTDQIFDKSTNIILANDDSSLGRQKGYESQSQERKNDLIETAKHLLQQHREGKEIKTTKLKRILNFTQRLLKKEVNVTIYPSEKVR